jgi:flagellar FliL protein
MKPLQLAFFFIYIFATSLLHAEDGEEGLGNVQYIPLKPAIITNYQSKKLSYIKVEITLQVTGNETAEAIDRHLPYIRHNLVMLFSRQEEGTLASAEGKSRLKEDALAAVISVLDSENEPTEIEAILFTSFIVE